ncbi:hypothetical protein AWN90_04160 [Nocardia terpenica]|uniref:Uncharacterized protein n=1 Tax=Nocardia terpenica TaxID=455432 RepID=A0A164IWT5_9NOCA|nr:hypothetical protein AWN90_04160 [Nocardia terpenica]NQE91164.1 DUF4192 family protein [Nocardia terpenica]
MLALAVSPRADAARQLWAAATRALPTGYCADPAALLAYSAYLTGDGTLAGIALDAALTADPQHTLALELLSALHLGISPDKLRHLATSLATIAADLGVDLDRG